MAFSGNLPITCKNKCKSKRDQKIKSLNLNSALEMKDILKKESFLSK